MTVSEHSAHVARIAQAATQALSRHGYYGTTIQEVATAVGLTKAGLLHYVGNKQGLMTTVLDSYDADVNAFANANLISDDEFDVQQGYPVPEAFRRIVRFNSSRPIMVRMFTILNGEATSPDFPFHDYFARRDEQLVQRFGGVRGKYPFRIPHGVDATTLFATCFNAMDGMQARWLRSTGADLNEMWRVAEDILFPLPLWSGQR